MLALTVPAAVASSSDCPMERLKTEAMIAENEALKKAVYENSRELKIANDKVCQLQNSNSYRREVVRLENVVSENESEIKRLRDELGLKKKKIRTLEESLTFFMNENTCLKNTSKTEKGKFINSATQANMSCGPCQKCNENNSLILELVELLEVMDDQIHAASDNSHLSVSQKDINDLVGVLDEIEKEIDADFVNCAPKSYVSIKSSTVDSSGLAYIPSKNDCSLQLANRFQPLQHVNNNTIPSPHNISSSIPLRPGPYSYSESVKLEKSPCTMILTDSMAGGVKMSHVKRNIGIKDRGVVIKRFPGHTAEEMAYYAPKPLEDKKPDQVIIIAGTNDLTRSIYDKGAVDEYEVVGNILKIGRAARDQGAKKIHISGIMARRGFRYKEIISRVNNLLYMACLAEDFEYMSQDDIKAAHISSDGIHLNSHGTVILMFNLFSVFNSFNCNFIDFKEEYDYAISIG